MDKFKDIYILFKTLHLMVNLGKDVAVGNEAESECIRNDFQSLRGLLLKKKKKKRILWKISKFEN